MKVDFLNSLLKKEPKIILGKTKSVYDYSENSKSFYFYDNQFEGRIDKIGIGRKEEKLEEAPNEMIEAINFIKKKCKSDIVFLELGGSRHQRRSGFPYFFYKNYIPVDISQSSMVAYSELYDRYSVVCNAEKLPFKDKSIDVIMTHTFLEHPINPDAVVKEIDRILKPGGYIVHSDAWHCRWWKRLGIYGVLKKTEMTLREKMLNLIITIYEFKLIRFPFMIVKRFIKELFIRKSDNLIFGKLIPNYDLKIYSDEDAAGNIDPIDLMRFYRVRGYKVIPEYSFFQKIFFNKMNVYLQKTK